MSKKKIITQTDLDNLRDELTALIESKITFITVDKVNELPATPPNAGESGRKKLGERHDLRARVDKVIFENLDNYANTYFSSNVSAALDAILWNFFDKPKLSFETGEKPQTKKSNSPPKTGLS